MKPFRPFLAAAVALAAAVVAPAKVWTVEEALATALRQHPTSRPPGTALRPAGQ
jgi:hypothetical protein